MVVAYEPQSQWFDSLFLTTFGSPVHKTCLKGINIIKLRDSLRCTY